LKKQGWFFFVRGRNKYGRKIREKSGCYSPYEVKVVHATMFHDLFWYILKASIREEKKRLTLERRRLYNSELLPTTVKVQTWIPGSFSNRFAER